MSNTPNRIIVSQAVGFRAHAKHPGKLFACQRPGLDHETVFTVIALSGSAGRPCNGSIKGYGVKTHAVIRDAFSGRKSLIKLSTLVDRGVRYVGMKNAVLHYFQR